MAQSGNAWGLKERQLPLPKEEERQLQLKSTADKLHDIYRNRLEIFAKVMPQDVRKVERIIPKVERIISADKWSWTFVDVIRGRWKFSVVGSEEKSQKMMPISWTITWTLSDEEVLKKLYTHKEVVYQFIPNDEGCMAIVDLISEKKNDDGPDPDDDMDFIVKMLKATDKYLQEH